MQSPNMILGTENSRKACKEAQEAFLKGYEVYWPNVSKAAKEVGLTRASIYQWRAKDKSFSEAMDAIKEAKLDAMEQKLAEVSQERGWYHLQLSILRSMRPEVWGDRSKVQHEGGLSWEIISSIPRPLGTEDAEQPGETIQ